MDVLNRGIEILQHPFLQVLNVQLSLMLLIQTLAILLVAFGCSKLFVRFLKRNLFNRSSITLGAQESISRVSHTHSKRKA